MASQWKADKTYSMSAKSWQVHGAAEAALLAASATARAELATACMAPERLAQEGPSLQLPEDVLQLACRLAAVAAQSIARSSAYPEKAPGVKVRDFSRSCHLFSNGVTCSCC